MTNSLHRLVRRGRRARQEEGGETLLELMATVVLLGVAIVGMVGAMIGTVRTTTQYRRSALTGNEAVNLAEAVRALPYVPCATAASYTLPTAPFRTTYAITEIRYLSNNTTAGQSWVSNCPTPDQGVQRIRVRATSDTLPGGTGTRGRLGAVNRTITIMKRDKRCPLTVASSTTAPTTTVVAQVTGC